MFRPSSFEQFALINSFTGISSFFAISLGPSSSKATYHAAFGSDVSPGTKDCLCCFARNSASAFNLFTSGIFGTRSFCPYSLRLLSSLGQFVC